MKRLAAVLLLLVPLPLLGGPVRAQAADAQGWWWTANQDGLPAAPPTPPDVGSTDLLLQGGDVQRLAGQPPAPTAVAALRFQVAPGAIVRGLVVPVAAGAQATDVRAYATSAAWTPAQGGALSQAPAADVSRYVPGVLSADSTLILFPDVGRLVTEEGALSLVLVPGATDRLVLHKPPATALAVTEAPVFASPDVPAPAAPLPAPAGPAAVIAPVGAPVTSPAAAPPVVAAPVAPAPAAVAGLVPVRRVLADDARTRWVVLAELVLLLLTFGLLGQGPLAAAARLISPATVEDDGQRGVGRFRAVRAGTAPRL